MTQMRQYINKLNLGTDAERRREASRPAFSVLDDTSRVAAQTLGL